MGASFRNIGEIKALAGCDFLTMSPWHFDALIDSTDPIPKKLDVIAARAADLIPKATFIDNEAEFRWDLLQDQVAFDKLHEGIKKFDGETEEINKLLRSLVLVITRAYTVGIDQE